MKHTAIGLGVLGCLAGVLFFTIPASASLQIIDHGGTYWGDVLVDRDQIVQGNLTVIGGDATIEGVVNGDLNVIGGQIYQRIGSTVTGHEYRMNGYGLQTIAPWVPAAHDWRVSFGIFADVVVLLVFLIFPARIRIAIDRLEHHPGLCAAFGLGGFVAIVPLAIVLAMTFILAPLILAEPVALIAGIFIGKAAISMLVGRRLSEMFQPNATATPAVALIVGLILVTAAELVPLVGPLVTALIWMVGLGAAILAFVNERGFGPIPGPSGPASAPIAGPPMTIG